MPRPERSVSTHGITVLIVCLGFTSPLSTDMCLPALTTMAADLSVSNSAVNQIVTVFFLFMAICTLIAGPLSDRFGRKRIMLTSLMLFVVGNAACLLSDGIAALVIARAVSACGAGGMLNASTALTKDVFSGRDRDRTLAIVQVFQIVAPLLSPVIGALLLSIASWHAVFAVLCAVGAVELVLAAMQPETQPADERGASTIGATFRMLGHVLSNRAFTVMLVCIGCLQACFMAYLASSSYIYQVDFGTTPGVYSLFFSASALVTMSAPVVYMKLLYGRVHPRTVYRRAQVGVLVGGICILTVGLLKAQGVLAGLGSFAPVLFWASFLFVAFDNSLSRPIGISVLLRQYDRGAGTLSALINFGIYLVGLVGMVAGSLDWESYLIALGGIVIALAVLALVLFSLVCRPGSTLDWEREDGD